MFTLISYVSITLAIILTGYLWMELIRDEKRQAHEIQVIILEKKLYERYHNEFCSRYAG